MIAHAPDRPWQPERTRLCARGRIVLRVAPGEAPERMPHYLDVALGRSVAPVHFDGGPVERVLKRFSPCLRVAHAFRSAKHLLSDRRAGGWDDLEHATGLSRTFRIEVDPEAGVLPLVSELSSLANVEACSPHYLCVTPFSDAPLDGDDASSALPSDRFYAQRMIGATEALRFEPGDATLIVAVVDSGIDLDHRELQGKLRPGVDTVDLSGVSAQDGILLVGDTREPDRIARDGMGHGTACASILGALGHRIPAGIAGAACLLPARALAAARLSERAALTAVGGLPDIDEAVKTAIDLGARVLNLSFGTPETALRDEDPRPHDEIVEYARRRGCILVAASGNDGSRTQYWPAAHPGVIAVGSVGESGSPSSFTTRGDHVELCAPGEHVLAAGLSGYQSNTGTSFAAPFVAGACALLVARAARYGRPLDPEDARALLRANAKPFRADARVDGCGIGILDVPAALADLERRLASHGLGDADLPFRATA